jgi:hypothetical protein
MLGLAEYSKSQERENLLAFGLLRRLGTAVPIAVVVAISTASTSASVSITTA